MRTYSTVALAMLAGAALGAAAVQGLHAQAKPPVYYIAEVEVTNPEAYAKEYVPIVQAGVKAAGGKLVAASSNVTSIEGAPPKRAAVQVWESMDKIMAWRNSQTYKDARVIGEKYAKFRAYALEGLPQ